MPQSVVPRRRTPIVFVAYGDGGSEWLRALRGRCVASQHVRELIERDVIQFWWVGGDTAQVDGIRAWPDVPPLPEVAAALDQARSAQATAVYADLNVRDVLVLERVSLFAQHIAERRRALRDVLSAVPDLEQQATHGQQGFRLRWMALADAVHAPTRTGEDARAAARDAALAAERDTLTLLVDRQDSAVAVIDEALAARCLGEVAMAFVLSDLGAPRNDGVPVSVPQLIQESCDGYVVSFGVAVIEHPWQEIEAARVRTFRRQLAAGIAERGALEQALGSASALLDAFEKDRAALDGDRYDRHARRRARDEALHSSLAWVFAEGDVRWMRGVVADIRQRAASLTVRMPSAVKDATLPAAAGSSVTTTALIQAPGATDVGSVDVIVLGAVGLTLLATVAAFLLARHKRRASVPSVAMSSDDAGTRTTPAIRTDVRREWEQLCEQFDALLDAWDEECRAARAEAHDTVASGALWRPAPPIAWRLTDALQLPDDDIAVTPELCRDLARHCMSLLDARRSGAAVLEEACRRELRRWDKRRHSRTGVAVEYLRRALSEERAADLRRFVDSRPYLANLAMPPEREAIVWLVAPGLAIEESLKNVEQAAARSATVLLSHDDDERSVRLSFARRVPWRAVPSLGFPQHDA